MTLYVQIKCNRICVSRARVCMHILSSMRVAYKRTCVGEKRSARGVKLQAQISFSPDKIFLEVAICEQRKGKFLREEKWAAQKLEFNAKLILVKKRLAQNEKTFPLPTPSVWGLWRGGKQKE